MSDKISNNRHLYSPLTMDDALSSGLNSARFIGLFVIWITLIGATISSVFLIEQIFGFSDVLNQEKVGQVLLVQIPMLIGMLLMFWIGFEWGFIPVFISTFVLAFTADMTWYWALMYSMSFTLGLSIYALSYYSFNVDLSLRSLKSFTFYVVISLFSALASSLGAFIWSRFYNLPLFETLIIWKSWWVSQFLQAFLIVGPLLFFLTPVVYRFREKYFQVEEKKEVSLTWIYSTIGVLVAVLGVFILSAKILGSQTIEAGIASLQIPATLLNEISSVNESFEIVTWISISLVLFIGAGSMYLIGSWNNSLQEKVDNQTSILREKELKLSSALDERNQLLNEIHDRVRSNLTIVLAILELQLKSEDKPDSGQILKDSHSLIRALTIVHESMAQTKRANNVNLKNYAIKLCNRIEQGLRKEKKEIQLTVNSDESLILEMDRAIPFALVINELVMNSCNHAFDPGDKGSVIIEIMRGENEIQLKVTDNGKGLPSNFDNQMNNGMGMRIVKAFSKQINGQLSYTSNDVTSFNLKIPVHNELS